MKLVVAEYMEFMFLGYPEHTEYYEPRNFLSLSSVDRRCLNFKVFKIKLFKYKFSKVF